MFPACRAAPCIKRPVRNGNIEQRSPKLTQNRPGSPLRDGRPKWPRNHEGEGPERRGKKNFESAVSRDKTRNSLEKNPDRKPTPQKFRNYFSLVTQTSSLEETLSGRSFITSPDLKSVRGVRTGAVRTKPGPSTATHPKSRIRRFCANNRRSRPENGSDRKPTLQQRCENQNFSTTQTASLTRRTNPKAFL